MADLTCGASGSTAQEVITDINANTDAVADLDTRVGDIEVAVVTPDKITFNPQSEAPDYVEGVTYYDANAHALSFYSDVDGVTLNIGQELVYRIYNNTGATILNGTALKAGTTTVGGIPTVVKSIADSLANGTVGGVATHDIADQTYGFATGIGSVGSMDTSAWTVGTRLYLSDTVAGTYTDVAPDIRTYVGFVLISDALNGTILINPNSLVNLPTVIGYMENLTNTTVTVTGTPQKFDGFAGGNSIVVGADTTNGLFTVPNTGTYEAKASIVIRDITANNAAQEIDVYFRINEGAANEKVYPIIIGRNATDGSGTPFVPLNLTAGDTVSIWYSSDAINEAVTIDYLTFTISSLSIH